MKWYGVEFSNEKQEHNYNGVLLPKIALFRAILKADGVENEATQCYNNTLLKVYLNEADLRSYNDIIDLVYNVDIVQSVPCNEAIKYGYDISVTVYYKEYGVYSGLFKTNTDLWNKMVEVVLQLQGSNYKKVIDIV